MVEKKTEKEGPDSDTPFTTATLAELFIQQGYLGKGLKIYQKLARFEPGNPDYKNKIAELNDRIQREGVVTEAIRNPSDLPFERGEGTESGLPPEKECAAKQKRIVSRDQNIVLETLNKWLTAIRKRKKHVQ